ncbi:MAG: twin-arginine translocase TatA/TatE family subunit [Dehalococcoidia bacterium]|nr:twin-arginine translocase TatA/TatE family subunit [Dehalococcoidia bacterium]
MGFWEVLLILLIAFIVVGPQKLPSVAREMGKGVRWFQKSYKDFKVTAMKELEVNDDDNKGTSQCNEKKN